ncbi:hypothetical protein [Chamaesiphon sp.]|uniref:hypothetical protein n=1 Tax=Chamaesiphon sp. TaxID=2814140 RepID=UPI00359408CA
MAAPAPLHGTELIDCAQANAKESIEVAANLCGYSDDIVTFERELQAAAHQMGITLHGFQGLTKSSEEEEPLGIEVEPDTSTEL